MPTQTTGGYPFELPQGLLCTRRGRYQLPMELKTEEKDHNFIHYVACLHDQDEAHVEKVVLIFGAKGTGKKTLYDFFPTVLYGFTEEEKRQVSIPKPTQSADSRVMPITAYTFPRRRGSKFQYTLTIVTVPGFVDAVGSPTNVHLLESIKHIFFELKYFDQLHGIAYVTNASKNIITYSEQSFLESMHHIFGDDLHRNLFILNTFADRKEPITVGALHAAGIHFHQSFQFNCSPLLLPEAGESDCGDNEQHDKLNWRMSENSMIRFLQCIAAASSINLQ